MRHNKWKNSIVAMFDELEAWEIKNVGQKQFSKCFELFVEKIDSVLDEKVGYDQENMIGTNNADSGPEDDLPAPSVAKSLLLTPIEDVDETSENQ